MVIRLPTYIDSSLLRYYSLDEQGRKTVTRILWQLAEAHPQITFAPTLYPMIAIFLHKHDQDYTYQTICQLLQLNQKSVSEKQFKSSILVPTTRLEHVRDIIVLIKLCIKNGYSSASKMMLKNLDPSASSTTSGAATTTATTTLFDTPFCDWYKWIFVALPLSYCTRIVDLWLEEGQKFMFRITLAILNRYKKTCSSPSLLLNSEKIFEFCLKLESLLEPKGGIEKLIKEAKSMKRISSVKIAKLSRKAQIKANLIIGSIMRRDNEAIKSIYNSGQSANYIKQPRDNMLNDIIICNRIAPRNFKSSIVDDYELLDDLWQYIPERAAVKTVDVVFNSNVDGTSLQTFFSRVDPFEDTIIIIRTTKNEVFGSYCSTSWATRKQQAQSAANKSCYFGNGETFLFTLQPKLSVFLWVGKSTDPENHLNHNNQLSTYNINSSPLSDVQSSTITSNNNNNNNNENNNNRNTNNHNKSLSNGSDKTTKTNTLATIDIHPSPKHRDSVTDTISSQLFMSATSQELIIGSGNGSFGLWLDADLTRGKTDHCRTFNNTPLCEDKDFTCKDVEVLALS